MSTDLPALFAKWDALRANVESNAWYDDKSEQQVRDAFVELHAMEEQMRQEAAMSLEHWAAWALTLLNYQDAEEAPEYAEAVQEGLTHFRQIFPKPVQTEGGTAS